MDNSISKWTNDAESRLAKIPEGFMRNMTKKRIEEHARANNMSTITFEIAQDIIEGSRAGMGSMMGGDAPGLMPDHVKDMLSSRPKGPDNKKTVDYYFCFVCNYAVPDKIPKKCPNCGSGSEKYSVLEPEYKTDAHTVFLNWSESAKQYLQSIPEGFKRDMSKNEIEAFSRKNGYKVVTCDIVDERLKIWGDISKNMASEMEWDPSVQERVNKIPDHIKGMVIKEVELFVRKAGGTIVTLEDLDAIRNKWKGSKEFHVKWQ